MNRPLALIEGDLTIPLLRPFDGLPPPFGTRGRVMREAVRQAVKQVADPARVSRFPPGTKHVLFYKAPPRRVDNGRWDVALAEAKRYLEMNTTRPRSSRSDRLLAASIFAGCTIALTWLLVTCSMKEAEKAKAVLSAPTIVSVTTSRMEDTWKPIGHSAVAATQTAVVAETAPSQAKSLSRAIPKKAFQLLPRQTVQVTRRDDKVTTLPAKPAKRVNMASLSEAQVNKRVALSRATHPAAQPATSKQPEWTAGASRPRRDAAIDDMPWLVRPAQQYRPSPAIRAATPLDNSWNEHMTQRRITDDPTAFHTDRSGK